MEEFVFQLEILTALLPFNDHKPPHVHRNKLSNRPHYNSCVQQVCLSDESARCLSKITDTNGFHTYQQLELKHFHTEGKPK